MSHSWKLIRQGLFETEYELLPGEWPVGRDNENKINCPSLVVSRRHCLINVSEDGSVFVKDLKSSNGTYIDLTKVTPQKSYKIEENQKIGIGINEDKIEVRNENDKYIFKLIKINKVWEHASSPSPPCPSSVVSSLKRKAEPERVIISSEILLPNEKENEKFNEQTDIQSNVINLLTDSESEDETIFKRIKLEKMSQEEPHLNCPTVKKPNNLLETNQETELSKTGSPDRNLKMEPTKIKTEPSTRHKNENELSNAEKAAEIPFDVFNVKAEYECDYDDPITIDSDIEDDSQIWVKRLSQSSPGRPSLVSRIDASIKAEQQLADNNEDIHLSDSLYSAEIIDNIVSSPIFVEDALEKIYKEATEGPDDTGGHNVAPSESGVKLTSTINEDIFNVRRKSNVEVTRQIEIIEPHHIVSRRRSCAHAKGKIKRSKSEKASESRIKLVDVKDERRKKLKEIAERKKDDERSSKTASLPNAKQKVNVKVTSSNRGAFLVESSGSVKPVTRRISKSKQEKDLPQTAKTNSTSHAQDDDGQLAGQNVEESHSKSEPRAESSNVEIQVRSSPEDNMKTKAKKVHFSKEPDQVLLFEIQPGNKLIQTSLCRNTLRNVQQMPVFTLEKSFLMSILHWNPNWLDEQLRKEDPPPILPHPPLPLRHTFESHTQYVSIVSNLLLMEVWESISQSYNRQRQGVNYLTFMLESSPPPPTDKNFGPVSINVNFSMPRNDSRTEPRVGELMVLHYGEEKKHFNYVQNVRRLPSPPNNTNGFFQLTLSTIYRDSLRNLRAGQELKGQNLGFIKNELTLMLSMDYLRDSPLNDFILRPEPQYFARAHLKPAKMQKSAWTSRLNHSQMEAVESSVHAALSDQPSIQLVQGPPGTGKSSVICSIVMRYFYGNAQKRHANRNKLLICTTSNAAIDELVLRLLRIRQTLPKPERFRMVRVGREAAMAAEAKAVSSQQLTLSDLHRVHDNGPQRDEEIMFLEAKVNSWKSAAESAADGDASRAAYCAQRARHFAERLSRARTCTGNTTGTKAPPSGEHFNACEQRVIEGADIIMTTLASCGNQKLKCLRRRIALCIVDEAGQAIEPEALLPLALDVSRLTLIGDPQQLPGFISSQRAKQYGLGESLFSRISQCAADWDVNPLILLDHQYRMHPEIALYPNKTFYKGLVGNGAQLRVDSPLPPYRLLYIRSGDNGQVSSGVNEMEAWAVSRVVLELSTVAKSHSMSLGVITPYRAHKDCILSCLHRLQGDSPALPIEVNTIDSFQGQERDIIVVSLARSQGLGFLADTGRMTVTLTRAKHTLFVCLNPDALNSNALWKTLINDANERQMSRWLPRHLSNPTAGERRDNVLRYLQ